MEMIDVYGLSVNEISCIHDDLEILQEDLENFLDDKNIEKLMNEVKLMKINEIKNFNIFFHNISIKYFKMSKDEFENLPEFDGW
jgi:hypothetical protein